ncbi:MAG TPA: VOC family protein [Opitutaceae bacterium]|nr:VOC family protein [Opitutaceae bacterium]
MNTTTQPSTHSTSSTGTSSGGGMLQIQPYLFFNGRCDEALEFYQRTLGATTTMLMRFKDCPEPANCPPGCDEKIMHAAFRVGATELFASDGCCDTAAQFQGVSLSLTVRNEAEAQRTFTALADGGEVRMPLSRTFFSPSFGMVADRFGVAWMVYVVPATA